jgi:signal transduction histidine kinase
MKSLRKQLTWTLSLASAGLLLTFTSIIFLATRHVMVSQFDATLSAKAQALVAAAEVDGKKFEFDFTVQDFAGFGSGVGGDYFEVRREDRRIVAVSPSLGQNALPPCAIPVGNEKKIIATTLGNGKPARMIVKRFDPSDDKKLRFPNLHIIVASQSTELQRHLQTLAIVLLICALLALLATAPLVRLAISRGLRPLDQLCQDVGNIDPHELKRTLSTDGMVRELKPIADRLNQLLARLDSSFEREKRFSSQAAHELRTPLAELKTMAEMGERWADEATPERCREMLVVIEELEAILSKLALLARGDEGQLSRRPEVIDLTIFHLGLASRYEALIVQKNLQIHSLIEPETSWDIDRFLLTSIYQNLLENAITYAPAGSLITTELCEGSIRISNPAPDLQAADLDHMFERFWQKNSAHNDYQHSGLGLSIVQTCARLIPAEVETSLEQGILTISIREATRQKQLPQHHSTVSQHS